MRTIENHLKRILFGATLFATPLFFTACHEEEEKKIDVQSNITGTWMSTKRVNWQLEDGSNWRYVEVSQENEGDWIAQPFTFQGDGTFFIEYIESDNHIVKHEGLYSLEADTITLTNLDNFPCRHATVTLSTLKAMSFATLGTNSDGKSIKTEYRFSKEQEAHKECAFSSISVDQTRTYICSEENRNYTSKITIRSSDNNVLLEVNSADSTVWLTKAEPVLVLNSVGYFSKSIEKSGDGTGKSILYYDFENKQLRSTTENGEIKNSVGSILFWEID